MNTKELQESKTIFIDRLKDTGRKGIDDVLARLEENGFFTAPASTRFHGAEEGGLLQHSINVWQEAWCIRTVQMKIRPDIAEVVSEASIAIAALLHDVCKAEVYVKEKKFRKNNQGKWEDYIGYGVDYSSFPMGHGEKSVVQLLRWGLEMTEAEMLAIRWHMGAFNLPFQSPEMATSLSKAKEKHPLVSIISSADELASYILESR